MFSKIWTKKSTESYSQQIEQLQTEFQQADAVLIGAGSGLSASADFTHIHLLRSIGHGGAVIFIITAM